MNDNTLFNLKKKSPACFTLTWFLFGSLFLFAVSLESESAAAELYVGGATVSITPELPVSLTGQMRTRIAKKVESEVTATVLVLESREVTKALTMRFSFRVIWFVFAEGFWKPFANASNRNSKKLMSRKSF